MVEQHTLIDNRSIIKRRMSNKPEGYARSKARRFHYLINRHFQLKYTWYLVTSAIMSALLVGGPIYYFLNQNYDIFLNMAYALSPEIVTHLIQEKRWFTGFFIFSILILIVFHFYYGIQLTFRMVGPIMALKHHMNMVTKGHLYQNPLHIRQHDEFHDLIVKYNYLYKTLRAQSAFDIKKLENIKFKTQNPEAAKLIEDMIAEKSSQISDPAVRLEPNIDSHHAS
jgi:hypothetical protein